MEMGLNISITNFLWLYTPTYSDMYYKAMHSADWCGLTWLQVSRRPERGEQAPAQHWLHQKKLYVADMKETEGKAGNNAQANWKVMTL